MRTEVSVAIVGGGVTGLATAYYVEQAAREEEWDLAGVLVEREDRLGGKLLTLSEEGFLVEGGPDSFLTQKPWALDMVKELGMEGDLLFSSPHQVFLLHQGRLHPVPQGMGGGLPTSARALWQACFLSLRGKARASLEPFVRRRRDTDDEPLGAFLRRRLGTEVAQRLAEPFVAGNHAGDAEQLSLRTLYPTLVQWEERHGSLTRGFRAMRASYQGALASLFCTLREGVASLPQAIATRLSRFTILSGRSVTELARTDEGEHPCFRVAMRGGEPVTADCVVLAIPADHAATLVSLIAPKAAPLMERLEFASTASVSLAFRRDAVAHSLDGSGFLVPRTEPSPVTACTWTSSKWPGRSPGDYVLLRAFTGWSGDSSFMDADDPDLVRQATEALRPLLGLAGEPDRAWVHRWPQAMPQYRVGHQAWLDSLESAWSLTPGLFFAGASYGGVGIPDCIRQAKEAAQRVRHLVSQRVLRTHA